LTRRQKLLASSLIGFLLLGSLVPTLTRSESWPFLAYPMYSRVMRMGHFVTVRVYGIPKDASDKRFYLSDPAHTHPFSLQRLTPALGHLMRRSREDSVEALRFVRDNYAARRRAGKHDGPELAGVALYGFEWVMDPLARNTDTPYKTTLLLEQLDDTPSGAP
jgi:hypothetical protein